jgi:hypothetical protein
MTSNLLLWIERMPNQLMGALAVLCLCTAGQAQPVVLSENYESYPLGAFGAVSDFSDASYMGANGMASIAAGQALEFSFDVKSNMGALNTNVAAPFPTLAMNNSSTNLADYTLEFDASIPSGINTGWFGVVEVATPGSGPRTQGLNMGALTPGGPSVHHSMSLAAMGQPFGAAIDPTNPNWTLRLVALGFPANGGGVRTTVRLDNVRVTVIPEPSSLLLTVACTGAYSLGRRRRSES